MEESKFKCDMVIDMGNTASVYFNQRLEFKTLCLISVPFKKESERKIQSHIKYRHKVAKYEMETMQARLNEVCSVIKMKNPSLVKQICKAVQEHNPWGGA